ncbi:ABC transporter permease, partial [Roseisolibacter sp. H3M3-2]|uniref:ABC transporter permease n=1 Tax=Roseisolibacter sp. H3M3-2 TaxID=3031323 RepID=UPI0023DA2C7B
RRSAAPTLREGGRGASAGAGGRRLRDGLFVAEVALSLVLLAGAGLMTRSMLALQATDPGFRPDGVLAVRLRMGGAAYDAPAARTALLERAADALRALPGAVSASAVNAAPLSGDNMSSAFAVEGRDAAESEARRAETRAVLPGYFGAVRLPLVRGRDFTAAEARDTAARVAIVNEAMAARWWPGEDPVGRRVSFGGGGPDAPWRTVVGVARDVRQQGLGRTPGEQAYLPFASFARREMTLLVRTGCPPQAGGCDPAALAPAARRAVAALDAGLPLVEVETLTAVAHRSLWLQRLYGALFGAFAGAAVLLATVGVYGVVAYAVAQRVRELGVRLAIDARRRVAAGLLLRDGVRLAALGLGAGLPLTLAATGALRSTLHGVSPRDPLVLVGTVLVLGAATVLASWLPARRAARVDPVRALRAD